MTKGAGSVGAYADSLQVPELLGSGEVDPSEAFAEAPFPLDIRDPDGRWIFANEAFRRCFGLTAPLGRSAFECLGREMAAAFTAGDQEVLRHGRSLDIDLLLDVEGERRTFNLRKFPLGAGTGLIHGIGSIALDVTEERRVAERLRNASALDRDRFENSPIPMTEEDWSGAKRIVDALRRAGVEDLGAHVRDHPEILTELVAGAQIVDVNAAAVAVYRSPGKAALIERFNAPPDLASYNPTTGLSDIFVGLLAQFRDGATRVELEGPDSAYDGSELYIRTTTSISPGHEQTWDRVLQTVEDVTDRKRAEDALRRSEERYALALKGAHDGIWDCDLTARRIYASEQTARIPGLEGVTGSMTLAEAMAALHPQDRRALRRSLLDHLRGLTDYLVAEARVPRPGEDDAWILIRGAGIRDAEGRMTRLAGSVTDINERKAFERELRRAKYQAQLADRAKSEFLANMSHELRTPLNAVLGFAEILHQERFGDLGSDRYREYAGDIIHSAGHLLAVINDVLDMAKIEANELDLRPAVFDAATELARILRLLAEQALAKEISLTLRIHPGDLAVNADQRIFRQIFLNLLSNAVKYTNEGGAIEIDAALLDDGACEIRVTDNGIGMQPEHIERAMRPFVQVHDASFVAAEGTGLGLPLVKRMVELHGGALAIESVFGEGTTATVRLPAERVVQAGADSK